MLGTSIIFTQMLDHPASTNTIRRHLECFISSKHPYSLVQTHIKILMTFWILQLCIASELLMSWAYYLIMSKVPSPDQWEQIGLSLGLLLGASGCIKKMGVQPTESLWRLSDLCVMIYSFPAKILRTKTEPWRFSVGFGTSSMNPQATGLQRCTGWARWLMKQCGMYSGEASMRSMKNGYG